MSTAGSGTRLDFQPKTAARAYRAVINIAHTVVPTQRQPPVWSPAMSRTCATRPSSA